jgi:hypothetical protein
MVKLTVAVLLPGIMLPGVVALKEIRPGHTEKVPIVAGAGVTTELTIWGRRPCPGF